MAKKAAKPSTKKPASKADRISEAAKTVAKAVAKSKSNKPLSALDAAAKILASADGPMTTKELVETMAAKVLWKKPERMLYSAISWEIARRAGRRGSRGLGSGSLGCEWRGKGKAAKWMYIWSLRHFGLCDRRRVGVQLRVRQVWDYPHFGFGNGNMSDHQHLFVRDKLSAHNTSQLHRVSAV
jgi:hypothetical protein